MIDPMEKTWGIVEKTKNLGADDVIAQTNHSRSMQIRFSNNEIDIGKVWRYYVTNVTLVWEKRLVSTQIQNFQQVDEKIKQLFKLAKVSKPNPMYGGVASGSFTYRKREADENIAELGEPAVYVESAIEAAKEAAETDLNTGGTLNTSYEDVYLASSEGPMGLDSRSLIELSIRAFSQKEASGHGVECSSTLSGFNPARAGEKAGKIARLAKNPVPGEEGKHDVIFDPMFTGSLLGMYSQMASAFNVMIQMSIFREKLGEKVAPEAVTIHDSQANYSISNRIFDDEGAPTADTVIIDRGVLKTYLHNTSTAKIFDTETTGNAGLVIPRPWNTEMKPGNLLTEELFCEVDQGIYLTNTWYTRFQNYAVGDFSTIPRDGAFIIEKGEIVKSLKDIRLSDNALRLLGNIKAVSKERQQIHWWESEIPSIAPFVLISDVNITRPR